MSRADAKDVVCSLPMARFFCRSCRQLNAATQSDGRQRWWWAKGIRGVEEGEVGGLGGTRGKDEEGVSITIQGDSSEVVDERAGGGKVRSWCQG